MIVPQATVFGMLRCTFAEAVKGYATWVYAFGFELVGECGLETTLSKWLPRKAEERGVRGLRVDSQKVGNCFNRTVWGIDGGDQY